MWPKIYVTSSFIRLGLVFASYGYKMESCV